VQLTAALAPAIQNTVQQLTILDLRQHLHRPAAGVGRTEAHEVQLARVADPRGAVQRVVDLLPPPQADVELTGAHTALISVVEARERVIALAL
jgi:hypothetical protein